MILTVKIRHNSDFRDELKKARLVADYALKHKATTSKSVSHFGLKSAISNQILKKYSTNKKIKKINRPVNLIIPNQAIQLIDKKIVGINTTGLQQKEIYIPCLKLTLPTEFIRYNFSKINQIEIGPEWAYISGTIEEPETKTEEKALGVDLNTTKHCAVVSIPSTGKVYKLGKSAEFIHLKYKNIRKDLQEKKKHRKLKTIRRRESNIIRDLNHKISREIVNLALENGCCIHLENLKGIRNNKKHKRSFNYSLSSWAYFQLRLFIEYKSKKSGVKVVLKSPRHTSQRCSRCKTLGIRNGKDFYCRKCGHTDHADANAGFNIAA